MKSNKQTNKHYIQFPMCICLGQVAQTLDQLVDFLSGTLLGVQQSHISPERSLSELVVESVESLREKGLITTDDHDGSLLLITKLGRASFKGVMTVCAHLQRVFKLLHAKIYCISSLIPVVFLYITFFERFFYT